MRNTILSANILATDGTKIIVDAEDVKSLSSHKWWVCRPRAGLAYAHTEFPDGTRIYMHRLLSMAPPGMVVDHRNDNGLDNRKQNLRLCSNKENCRRRRGNAGISGFRGVQFVKSNPKKPWRARIKVDGRFRYLGYYAEKLDAVSAYNSAAINHFGEFARPHNI